MRQIRIYTQQELIPGSLSELEAPASHHLSKVLRMKTGDSLQVFNGNGGLYQSTIENLSKKNVSVLVHKQIQGIESSPLKIHLGQVVSRGDKMDYTLQKATELGVHAITPIFSQYCEVKLTGIRLEKKMLHWQQVIINACEQSGRNELPTLHTAENIDQWVRLPHANALIMHPDSTSAPLKKLPIKTDDDASCGISLLIGPEGGFSPCEITLATESNFTQTLMGPRTLRTETAGLAAISILQSIYGDM